MLRNVGRTAMVTLVIALGVAASAQAAAYNDAVGTAATPGLWTTAATWGGSGAPINSGDTATIDSNVVSTPTSVTNYAGVTAYLNTGGTLKLGSYFTVQNLHLAGGTLSNYTAYYDSSVSLAYTPTVTLDANTNSTVKGLGLGKNGGKPLALTGSGTLTYDQFDKNGVLYVTDVTDFTGTIVVKSALTTGAGFTVSKPILGASCTIESQSGQLTSLEHNGVTTPATADVVNATLVGEGSFNNKTSAFNAQGNLKLDGIIHPGANGATDAKTLTMITGTNADFLYMGGSSNLTIDVLKTGDATAASDLFHVQRNVGSAVADHFEILSGASITLNLPDARSFVLPVGTLEKTFTLTILDVGGALSNIKGTYDSANITYNNSTGWKDLSVTKSADNKSFTFTGTVPEPASLVLLAIGGGLVALRRRRQ